MHNKNSTLSRINDLLSQKSFKSIHQETTAVFPVYRLLANDKNNVKSKVFSERLTRPPLIFHGALRQRVERETKRLLKHLVADSNKFPQ